MLSGQMSRIFWMRPAVAGAPPSPRTIVRQIQAAGVSGLQNIADALNDRGVRTARGGAWHNSTVRNLLARA